MAALKNMDSTSLNYNCLWQRNIASGGLQPSGYGGVSYQLTSANQNPALILSADEIPYGTWQQHWGESSTDLLSQAREMWGFMNSMDAAGQGKMTGFPENDFIKHFFEGTAVFVGVVQTGFDAARKIQPKVSTWIKGAKGFGITSNVLGIASIGYDFATGNANSSTVVDGLFLAGGAAVLFFASTTTALALAPWIAGAGVVYGIVSISGGEAWLDRNIDISGYINFVKPSKP